MMGLYNQMHHCIHLLQRRRKYDEYGDISQAWADMGRVWAKIENKGTKSQRPIFEITIRHPKYKVDRIEWEGSAYEIVSGLEEDARRTWQRFLIAPVN